MNTLIPLLVSTPFLLVVCGCNVAEHRGANTEARQQAADVTAIKQLAEDWRHAWIAGDANALVNLYGDDDPALLPQNQPAIRGKDAIREIYTAVLNEFAVEGGGEMIDYAIAGDWAYYWHTYTITATPKAGGETLTDTGKSVFILRQQPTGEWRIARLTANSDLPPPAN